MWILGAVLLGVLSRIEERVDGFDLAISSNPTWCAAAFLVGRPLKAAAAMTVANASYYAYVAVAEPDLSLAFAGPPARWFVIGIAAGVFFGTRHWVAALALLAVVVSETTGAGAAYLP